MYLLGGPHNLTHNSMFVSVFNKENASACRGERPHVDKGAF